MIIIESTLRYAMPLIIAALGGMFSELSGVVNIALEGIMLLGSFTAVAVAYLTGSPYLGVLAAMVGGAALASIHAVVSIRYKANQVVSGTAINILASGVTTMLARGLWAEGGSPPIQRIPDLTWPFRISPFVPLAFLLVALCHWFVYYTPMGLRLRAVGEHPKAADTAGISVERMRYFGVLMSGVFAGLAGAGLSVGLLSAFEEGMTNGRGFIALAALIFGKWTPVGACLAALLFGAATASQTFMQALGIQIPAQFLLMAPYILTMLALAGVVGRATPPASVGIPYEKGES
ncbi:MAG: ABC transporter permease [Bacillota bacterium]|nr:MAG: ABC transporter permease [Bacillota bacterium]